MSRLTDLLRQARMLDPQLAADLEGEVGALMKRRTFGLVFERHQPEAVELPGRPIRRGDKVRVLPPRGVVTAADSRVWRVESIATDDHGRTAAHLALQDPARADTVTAALDDLVVVAEFRDRIYPGLVETDRVECGEGTPFHSIINGENFHVLQLLNYTHRGKVDCIYIDPPYNSGAKDWKYNNHYVESDDAYRHSKWLAFIERRLTVARDLLKTEDSVLIVTIDEKEYLRLGLLLEQTFPEARITMVTASINGAGSTRSGTFNRAAEYIYFVQFGQSAPEPLPLGPEWNPVATKNKSDIRWNLLMRSGTQPFRTTHPNLFYPVYVRNTDDGPVFHSVGDAYYGDDWQEQEAPEGSVAVWPIRKDGREGRWQVSPEALRGLVTSGAARLGKWNGGRTTPYYLKAGERRKIESGLFKVVGRRTDGSVVTDAAEYTAHFVPTDVWRISSHDAGNSGSRLVSTLIPDRPFPYPKSLYAVEDALRFFVARKPDAVIVDFFAGSGTTAHAVMRLNRQDGGRRVSISVTNNEVSATEQRSLRSKGLRPGDPDWEQLGICEHVTKPRVRAAITGETHEGKPVEGDYRFSNEFPIAEGLKENAVFFSLTYEQPLAVRHHRAFQRISPMLWLRAGSRGQMLTDLGEHGWAISETYGVLADLDNASGFLQAVSAEGRLTMAFIVTDDDSAFQMVCRNLPDDVEPVRLYESYLSNFEINAGAV